MSQRMTTSTDEKGEAPGAATPEASGPAMSGRVCGLRWTDYADGIHRVCELPVFHGGAHKCASGETIYLGTSIREETTAERLAREVREDRHQLAILAVELADDIELTDAATVEVYIEVRTTKADHTSQTVTLQIPVEGVRSVTRHQADSMLVRR